LVPFHFSKILYFYFSARVFLLGRFFNAINLRRVTTLSALEKVMDLCDMIHFNAGHVRVSRRRNVAFVICTAHFAIILLAVAY
jgi:hypothetical protein